MYLTIILLVHVVISLVAIGSGFVVMAGLAGNKRLDRWTAFFLVTTVLTSVTGYLFPFEKLLPSHIIGALSLVALAAAIYGRYPKRLAGIWRPVYVVNATIALYFNVFVLVVQLFRRIPPLHALAPTESEPPFAVAQLIVLIAFVALGYFALRGFKRTDSAVAAA